MSAVVSMCFDRAASSPEPTAKHNPWVAADKRISSDAFPLNFRGGQLARHVKVAGPIRRCRYACTSQGGPKPVCCEPVTRGRVWHSPAPISSHCQLDCRDIFVAVGMFTCHAFVCTFGWKRSEALSHSYKARSSELKAQSSPLHILVSAESPSA